MVSSRFTVTPEQISAIDIVAWDFALGVFHGDGESMCRNYIRRISVDEQGQQLAILEPRADRAWILPLWFGGAVRRDTRVRGWEINAAVDDDFFECVIPWASLGSPMGSPGEGPNQARRLMTWAIRITRGQDHEYLPHLSLTH